MPSTYTTDLRLEQQVSGENSSTWGTKVNASIQQIEDAVAGYLAVATTGGTTTLTTVNGGTDQARYAILKITGALVSNATIVAPDVSKEYIIWNATTEAYTVTVKNTSGTGVVVTQGAKVHLFCDGAEMYVAAVSLAGTETLSNKTLTLPQINDALADHQYVFEVSELAADRTVTLPQLTGNDEFVFKAHTQALTNKTYNGNTWTAGTGVLTIGAGKTATFNNTLTFSGTDSTVMTFPSTSATIARIDAANTFTGLQTFSTGITSTAASNSFGASVFSGNITSSGNPSLNIGTGALTAGSLLASSTGGVGYGTGAGGTVTQLTGKGTSVTLNKPTGLITTANDALGAGAYAIFSLLNSTIGTYDGVDVVHQGNIGGTITAYDIRCICIVGGAAYIKITNTTGGSLSEAVGISFRVIKGIAA